MDFAWLKVALVCVLHIIAPKLRPLLQSNVRLINSFGGGMAVTYVFLHLLPEVDEGEEVFGRHIYLFVLIGFLLFYGLERFTISRHQSSNENEEEAFLLSFSTYCCYNWLLVYGMPRGISVDAIHVSLVGISICLHLLHQDFIFGISHPTQFDRWGRWALTVSMLLGLVARYYIPLSDKTLTDCVTAFLAGSVVYSVFRNELPTHRESHFGWFTAGIALYAVLLTLAERL